MDLAESVLGCLIGGAIGDAMGSAYEGAAPGGRVNDALPWTLTDDTQLTLATCEAITQKRGVDPEIIAQRMTQWFREDRVTRLGAGTLKALRDLAAGSHWALSGRRGEMSAGVGPAARIAPLGFWLDPANFDDRRTVRDVVRITHHSDEAYAGALAIMTAVRLGTRQAWSSGGDLASLVTPLLPDTNLRDRLVQLSPQSGQRSLMEVAKQHGASGYVVEAVPLAIFAAQRAIDTSFAAVLDELMSVGGDTDTIASLTGQIVGARVGRGGLPQDYIARVPGVGDVQRIGELFLAELLLRG